MNSSLAKIAGLYSFSSISCIFISYLLFKSFKKLNSYLYRNANDLKEPVNEVLFFPDPEYPCSTIARRLIADTKSPNRLQPNENMCRNPSCQRLHNRQGEPPSSMLKFITYLTNARHRVDLCIYMFTQAYLSEILQYLDNCGVEIRIITDAAEDDGIGTQVPKLQAMGIKVRSNKRGSGALMHHKFVIIDDEILLAGSFNWTNKAVVSNYEAVLITSEQTLVKPFVQEFNRMWSKFDRHEVRRGNHNGRNQWNS